MKTAEQTCRHRDRWTDSENTRRFTNDLQTRFPFPFPHLLSRLQHQENPREKKSGLAESTGVGEGEGREL